MLESAPRNLRVAGEIVSVGRRLPGVPARPQLLWDSAALIDGQPVVRSEIEFSSGLQQWTSRVVELTRSSLDVGFDLAGHRKYQWRVRNQNELGSWSEWSEPSTFWTGPLHEGDWAGSWITHEYLRSFRFAFESAAATERTALHVATQGLVQIIVNGTLVNDGDIVGTRTDVARALSSSFDISDLTVVGENFVELHLGLGDWVHRDLPPRVRAMVGVHACDRSTTFFGTGESSEAGSNPVTIDQPFYVERRIVPSESTFTHRAALAADDALPARIYPDTTPPVRPIRRLRADPPARSRPGVYDIGTNVAGRSVIAITGLVPAGTVIRVTHGEILDPAGRVDTTNLRMPYDRARERQVAEYEFPKQIDANAIHLTPWFSYYGFRYLQVSGVPSAVSIDVAADILHSDVTRTGRLTTNSPVVNELSARAERTLLNNLHGLPEDCPTREQAGWTGDTSAAAQFDFAAFDLEALFGKWLDDFGTSQLPSGALPAIIPDYRIERIPPDPVWGSALHRVLEGHWLHYGDERTLRRAMPVLRRWIDFLLDECTVDGITSAAPMSYGHDWLALEQTPPDLLHTWATLETLTVAARLEDDLGMPEAAARYREAAGAIRVAARRRFLSETGVVANGSHVSLAIAITELVDDPRERSRMLDQLVASIRAHGDRVTSGFAGTRVLLDALGAERPDVVADVLHQGDAPGVGAMLVSGPGTFWESWQMDPTNTGTGSLDHLGLGGPFAA